MSLLLKYAGLVLVSVILVLAIEKREFSAVLVLTVCISLGIVAFSKMQPIIDLLWEISDLGKVEHSFLTILIKIAGIATVADLVGIICVDSGNGSLAKVFQFFGSILILVLSLPIIRSLLEILQEMLQNL